MENQPTSCPSVGFVRNGTPFHIHTFWSKKKTIVFRQSVGFAHNTQSSWGGGGGGGGAGLLALVCGVFCEFVTFPLVSWVRCGTWLYRFLIFATLLTFTVGDCLSCIEDNKY